jgi:hypothetical protein
MLIPSDAHAEPCPFLGSERRRTLTLALQLPHRASDGRGGGRVRAPTRSVAPWLRNRHGFVGSDVLHRMRRDACMSHDRSQPWQHAVCHRAVAERARQSRAIKRHMKPCRAGSEGGVCGRVGGGFGLIEFDGLQVRVLPQPGGAAPHARHVDSSRNALAVSAAVRPCHCSTR